MTHPVNQVSRSEDSCKIVIPKQLTKTQYRPKPQKVEIHHLGRISKSVIGTFKNKTLIEAYQASGFSLWQKSFPFLCPTGISNTR